jgi:hypothetical protein
VQLADVEAAARVLMRCPAEDHRRMIAQMLAEAEIADQFRLQHRAPHPVFGTGTLMSAAAKHKMKQRPTRLSPTECAAYTVVFKALCGDVIDQSS